MTLGTMQVSIPSETQQNTKRLTGYFEQPSNVHELFRLIVDSLACSGIFEINAINGVAAREKATSRYPQTKRPPSAL
jgi:hypothetical protein